MKRSANGQILTGQPVNPDTGNFYVSVISEDGQDFRLVLGPYDTQEQAQAQVHRVRAYLREKNFKYAHWFAYGTAGVAGPRESAPVGILNTQVGLK